MRRIATVAAAAACTITLLAGAASATSAPAPQPRAASQVFRLAPLPARFEQPTWVGGAGDGTSALLIAEQRGIVWRLAGTRRSIALDLRSATRISGEQGLLAVAPDARYATTRRIFVYFVRRDGVTGQVRSYRMSAAGKAVPGSGRVVINVPLAPPVAANHNGGQLWSRADGTLWLSVGDGGGGGDPSGNGQKLSVLMGKLLRITPKPSGGYTIPRGTHGNPFVARTGARKEVFALGLRNPWRFSIDEPTGNVWLADVGQGEQEEVDVFPAARNTGLNFGWSRFEGTRLYNSSHQLTPGTKLAKPRFVYSHARGGCSITGGVIYRGPIARLRGWYLHGDYCLEKVTAYNPTTKRSITVRSAPGIVAFGASVDGNVFAVSQQPGRVYKLVAG